MSTNVALWVMSIGVVAFAVGASVVMAYLSVDPKDVMYPDRRNRRFVDVGTLMAILGVVLFCLGMWWAQ